MIARWAVPLDAVDTSRIAPDHLHAAVCGWVDGEHRESPKPWSARPLRIVDGIAAVEVCTLTEQARDRLLANAVPGLPVRFGAQHTRVLTGPQLVDVMGVDPNAPSPNAWSLQFLTPTAFGNGSRFSPWPDPRTVIRSCTMRYNAFSADERVDPAVKESTSVWVSDIDGRSEILTVERLTVSGFMGRIRYVCDDRAFSDTFDTLMRFAEFAGLGRYTTRGLGTVQLKPTWST